MLDLVEASAAKRMGGDPLGLLQTILERRYRIDRLVAEGGFGIVYQAHHLALGVPVALKVLRPSLRDDPEAFVDLMNQFREEAKVLSRLRRASVVAVLDSGVSALGGSPGGLPWMALEWLEGETLKEHLARRRGQGRTPAECLELMRPALEAIAEAHDLGIAHRDLKPSNIMLVPTKGGVTPRVLDFGIAKMMAGDNDPASAGDTTTSSSQRAFTASCAAPEQLSGARTGPWTDVYALGLLLTEVLTDRPPIPTRDANERYRVAFAKERPTPGSMGVDVGRWEGVLTRALAVRPSDRQRDARELLEELDAAGVSVADVSATTAGETQPRRRRWGARRSVALVSVLACVAVASLGASRRWASGREPVVVPVSARPLVIVSEFDTRGAVGMDPHGKRVAATFAELLSEQLRIGDAMRLPAPDARAAMLEASRPDLGQHSTEGTFLSRLRAATGADLVVGGALEGGGSALSAEVEIRDVVREVVVAHLSVAGSPDDVTALVRETGARIRRSLGRPALSAQEEVSQGSSLPESTEASMLYVEGLHAMRVFRFHEAAERLEEAHAKAPRFAPALAALARARLQLGEQDRAREAAEQAAERAPGLPRGDELQVYALSAETRQDWATAVDNYRALVQFYPDRVDYVTSLARALVGAGKAPDASLLLESAKKRPQSDWDRIRLDLLASYAYSRQSQDALSMAAAREAEEYATKVGARVLLADAVLEQAHGDDRAGRLDEAEALFLRARDVYVDVHSEGAVLRCDAALAGIARSRGDLDRAIALGETIVAAHRKAGNLYRLARETNSLGLAHASAGHLARARALFDEAGQTYIEAHDREGEAYRLLNMAEIDLMLGHLDGVADGLKRGRQIHAEINHASGVAEADGALAHLAWYEGRFADAEKTYEVAFAEASAVNEASVLAEIALDRASFALERRSAAESDRFADARKAIAGAQDLRYLALFDALSSRRALAHGDAAEARKRASAAEERARQSHAPDAIVRALAAALDAKSEGRDARQAELATRAGELEAAEPAIVAWLALGRAASGDQAAALARRAYDDAASHGLVSLAAAAAAQRQLARSR
jgi:hypothetical protein